MESNCCNAKPLFEIGYAHGIKMADDDKYYGICGRCKENAELTPDFSSVTCTKCGFDMTYGEYVKFVAHNEAKYSDILGDYTGSTEGETAGTLDDWED